MKKTKWFSATRMFEHAFMFGIGVGWCKDDRTASLVIEFGRWVVVLGPHLPPNA